MATRNYIISIDDSELTEELQATLQRLGARLADDEPEPLLTEADKRVLTERKQALDRGEVKLIPLEEAFEELRQKHFGK